MLDSFKNYVSIDERDTLINALESFEESDELLELLSAYHCYKKPKKENIDEIFVELAHQEIVQKPRYVSNCITEEFSKNRPKEFSSIDSLDMLYQQLKPTAKPSNEIKTLLTTYFRKGFIYKEILDLFREYIIVCKSTYLFVNLCIFFANLCNCLQIYVPFCKSM